VTTKSKTKTVRPKTKIHLCHLIGNNAKPRHSPTKRETQERPRLLRHQRSVNCPRQQFKSNHQRPRKWAAPSRARNPRHPTWKSSTSEIRMTSRTQPITSSISPKRWSKTAFLISQTKRIKTLCNHKQATATTRTSPKNHLKKSPLIPWSGLTRSRLRFLSQKTPSNKLQPWAQRSKPSLRRRSKQNKMPS